MCQHLLYLFVGVGVTEMGQSLSWMKTQLVSRTTLLTYFCRLVSLSVVWDPKVSQKYIIFFSGRNEEDYETQVLTKNQIHQKSSVGFWDGVIWSICEYLFCLSRRSSCDLHAKQTCTLERVTLGSSFKITWLQLGADECTSLWGTHRNIALCLSVCLSGSGDVAISGQWRF